MKEIGDAIYHTSDFENLTSISQIRHISVVMPKLTCDNIDLKSNSAKSKNMTKKFWIFETLDSITHMISDRKSEIRVVQ